MPLSASTSSRALSLMSVRKFTAFDHRKTMMSLCGSVSCGAGARRRPVSSEYLAVYYDRGCSEGVSTGNFGHHTINFGFQAAPQPWLVRWT